LTKCVEYFSMLLETGIEKEEENIINVYNMLCGTF
jgi:hypothetical protein